MLWVYGYYHLQGNFKGSVFQRTNYNTTASWLLALLFVLLFRSRVATRYHARQQELLLLLPAVPLLLKLKGSTTIQVLLLSLSLLWAFIKVIYSIKFAFSTALSFCFMCIVQRTK
jgi:uncharacterized membrane protein